MNYIPFSADFNTVALEIQKLLADAPDVNVGEWQAIQNAEMPQAQTIEIEDVSFQVRIPKLREEWQRYIKPNLPWAEDHFLERVSGIPHNPPPSSAWWPYAQKNNAEFKSDEKFSHTYPERFWAKKARVEENEYDNKLYPLEGIRYTWGDLDDVVNLLRSRPGTRQAYLPVWFPEDTGAVAGQRVPCTLGYHFLVRSNGLKIVYYIRSCDFFRHFRDDVYMAGRLAQWVGSQVGVPATKLVMHISSMHVFSAERSLLTPPAQAMALG